jgi:hypothetical protein
LLGSKKKRSVTIVSSHEDRTKSSPACSDQDDDETESEDGDCCSVDSDDTDSDDADGNDTSCVRTVIQQCINRLDEEEGCNGSDDDDRDDNDDSDDNDDDDDGGEDNDDDDNDDDDGDEDNDDDDDDEDNDDDDHDDDDDDECSDEDDDEAGAANFYMDFSQLCVKPSEQNDGDAGLGLFATTPLQPWNAIPLVGRSVTDDECEALVQRGDGRYLVETPGGTVDGNPSILGHRGIGYRGAAIWAFANEKSAGKPNCTFMGAFLVVAKAVRAGEELTVGYGPDYVRQDYVASHYCKNAQHFPQLDK